MSTRTALLFFIAPYPGGYSTFSTILASGLKQSYIFFSSREAILRFSNKMKRVRTASPGRFKKKKYCNMYYILYCISFHETGANVSP